VGDEHNSGHAAHGSPRPADAYGQGQSGGLPAQSLTSATPVTVLPSGAALYPPASLHNQPGRTEEVSLHDNYYSASYLTVPAGTLVRWKNVGHHSHTVTFPRRWDSGPLAPGAEFSA